MSDPSEPGTGGEDTLAFDAATETVDEWKAEAERWKESAAEQERVARENADAAKRLQEVEAAAKARDAEAAGRLSEAEREAKRVAEEARREGEKSSAEWRAEAEKWKQSAAELEQTARENAEAAQLLDRVESSADKRVAQVSERLSEAEREAKQIADEAKAAGEKTAAEWQAEAEKWKALSRKNEERAKENLAAVRRLEKLEADNQTLEQKSATDTASLEAKATEAEAKAMRYEVASAMGVPAELMQFLTGSSKKELEDQADRLLATIDKNPPLPDESDDQDEPDVLERERSELAEAQKRAAEAEAKALRYEVAAEKKLAPDLADFLSATTREDLVKQADVLLSITRPQGDDDVSTRTRMPQKRLRSGAVPDTDPEPDSAELARIIRRKERGY